MFGIDSREWRKAVILVAAIKIASLLVLYAGWAVFDRASYIDEEGNKADLWITRNNTGFCDNLANFDGAWFIRIAAIGYQRLASRDYDLEKETERLRVMDRLGYDQGRWPPEPDTERFDRGYGYRHWPLFAWVIALPVRLGIDAARAAVVLANLFAMAYGILLYALARKDLGEGAALLCVALSQLHPGGYSLSGAYNESLFLLLAVGAMLSARRGRWWLAGSIAMAAGMTRIFGVVLAAPLFYEWLTQRAESETGQGGFRSVLGLSGLRRGVRGLVQEPSVWWLMLVPLGPLAVFLFFHLDAGDALIWSRVHEANVHGNINWPWLMMMETYNKGWLIAGKELPLHGLLLATLILSFGRVRGAYWVWMLLFFLYHTSSGNHSYLRYQVQCLPLFVALAALTFDVKWLWLALLCAFGGVFAFFCVLWINGYWVA